MKHLPAILLMAFAPTAHAQSWGYVGASCVLPSGSAEVEFRSDGSAIAVSFEAFGLSVRAWDGSVWSNLPGPPSISGLIGGFDLEIQDDVAYLAVSNTQLKVFRLDGTDWTALGSGIPGTWSTNYDFAVNSNGVPHVVHGLDRKVYVFDGTSWNHIHTFPQGFFPNIIGYHITGDNTLSFDAADNLVYVISVSNKQLLKRFDGSVETVVGDTITPHPAFTPYTTNVFRNGAGDLFVTLQRFGGTPFIKRYDGSNWSQFGDTTGLVLGVGNMLLDFTSDDELVLATYGHTNKRVLSLAGASAPFTMLDTLSHSGFAQTTDIDVDPTDGSVQATFNCLPTAAVMKYAGATYISDAEMLHATVFPNPCDGVLRVVGPEAIAVFRVLDTTGRMLLSGRVLDQVVDLSPLPAGTYHLHLMDQVGRRAAQPVVKL